MADNNQINWITVAVSLASSLISAGFASLLSRKKTKAETVKLLAEAKKLNAEAEKIRLEMTKLLQDTSSLSEKIDINLSGKSTEILYYGNQDPTGFDFTVEKTRNWDASANKETGNRAGGNFTLVGKVLNIERSDNEGRFCLILNTYIKKGQREEYLKADPALSSKRRILVSCEAKSLNGTGHVLEFVLRERNSYEWLSAKSFTVNSQAWTTLEAYLTAGPDKDFYLKIYDHYVEKPPSSIQIRNLKFAEFV